MDPLVRWLCDERVAVVTFLLVLMLTQASYVYSLVSYNTTVTMTPELQVAYSQAFLGYRSNTGTNGLSSPKVRIWNGSTWASETELTSAGSVARFTRVACCPLGVRSAERILVTLSVDGYLDAYVWNGSSWLMSYNVGFVGRAANAYRCFDVGYEGASGRGVVVYAVSSTNAARDMAYRIWNGTQWSSESYINIAATRTDLQVYWIALASKPTQSSNEIALNCIDGTNSDAYGFIWNGSAWGNEKRFTNSVSTAIYENIAVAYEQQSGIATFIYATRSNAYSWQWSGSSWDASGTLFDLTGSAVPYWFSLKADPASDRLLICCVDGDRDLNTADWNGDEWVLHPEHDRHIGAENTRCVDVEWEPDGSKALMVWDTMNNYIHYKTWTPLGGWSAASRIPMTSSHPWVQLTRNPRNVAGDVKILGATIEGDRGLGSLRWVDNTLSGVAGAFTSDVTQLRYESFELAFLAQ